MSERPVPAEKYVWLLIFAIGILYILTLRKTVSWSGAGSDTWVAIYHGLNVFLGRPYSYSNIHYLSDFTFNNIVYPPLTGIVQVGGYIFSGGHYREMKLPGVLGFVAFLALFSLMLKRRLGGIETWYATLLVGLSPYYFTFKEELRTDLLYLALLYATVVLFDSAAREAVPLRKSSLPASLSECSVAFARLCELSDLRYCPGSFFTRCFDAKDCVWRQ